MLLDNKQNGKVGEALSRHLNKGSKLSLISGLFSIYGFESLKKELTGVDEIRLLLSKSLKPEIPLNTPFAELTGDRFEHRLRNQLNQMQIAKECAQWIEHKVDVRSTSMANQNLFHISKADNSDTAIQGSSHFTSTGLGFSESDQFDMNMCLTDSIATQGMLEWFNAIWDSPSASDAKQLLLDQLNQLTQNKSPQFIYFLTLYHLFKDFLEEIDEQYFGQFLPSISGACSVVRYLLATQGCPRLAIKYQPLFTGLAPRELSPRKTVHSIG